MSAPDLPTLVESGPVHFVGAGGAGMNALAELVLRSGGRVTGCDTRRGPATRRLEELGATVRQGHDPAHLEGVAGVVYSPAVPPETAEMVAARERGLPLLKRARALGSWVNRGRVVAVGGTHGKTTTCAMATEVLVAGGLDPTGVVGGRVPGWGGNLRYGQSDLFVVEADEYDRSFHHLEPRVAVVTNLEADHLDIYHDLEGVRDAFRTFAASVCPGGRLVVCADDPGAARLLAGVGECGYTYGTGAGAQLRAVDVDATPEGSRFRMVEEGKDRGVVSVPAPGLHNLRNALAAVAVARYLGVEWDAVATGLSRYGGVGRRFQRLGEAGGVLFVDDYAHHPTEIRATLEATRELFGDRRLVAVFQPHLFTRTRDFATEFGSVLAAADVVWLTDVYPAREDPIPGVSGRLVVDAVSEAGGAEVHYAEDLASLEAELERFLEPGDLCLTLGAGSVEEVGPDVRDRLSRSAGVGAREGPRG